jgi:hypothetical protein
MANFAFTALTECDEVHSPLPPAQERVIRMSRFIRDPDSEAWFRTAANQLRPLFETIGYPIPENTVICGSLPRRRATRIMGECRLVSRNGPYEILILISPGVDDSVRVMGTYTHQLIHASVGLRYGHRKPFSTVARAFGLEGPMPATTEGETFRRIITPVLEAIGAYPGIALRDGINNDPKKQKGRLHVCWCPEGDYRIWTTKTHLERGIPQCPIHLIPLTYRKAA